MLALDCGVLTKNDRRSLYTAFRVKATYAGLEFCVLTKNIISVCETPGRSLRMFAPYGWDSLSDELEI